MTLLSIPVSSMAAKRMIPPDEPSRDMARATAESKKNVLNTNLLQNILSDKGQMHHCRCASCLYQGAGHISKKHLSGSGQGM